jgi:hypothetical protein
VLIKNDDLAYLNICRLKVDEEKITKNETNGNSNSKTEKPQNGTEETHFQSEIKIALE